ncbi:MAG: hypothetical protein O9311_08195 [Cytophagales bacterium]|nr:hypothetical protein [Cytophagales bacterium]
MSDFFTEGQQAMQETAFDAWKMQHIKFIETPHGTGLAHALAGLRETSPHVKTVHIDCLRKRSLRHISVVILREAANVKFSNFSHLSVNIDRLLLVVKQRMVADLKTQKVLLVIDHIDVLNNDQLHRLVQLLQFRKPPCGILLRTTTAHRLKISIKAPELHDALYVTLTPEPPKMVAMMTKEERTIFIRDQNEVSDAQFVKDLAKNNWGFSKVLGFIGRYKKKGGK